MVKVAGLNALTFEGPGLVFENEEDCMHAVRTRQYQEGNVLVIRNEGPRGGPGMREMLGVTSLIYGQGMGEKVALLTDGRFSGVTRGMCSGDRKSTRLNSSHVAISYAAFGLKE